MPRKRPAEDRLALRNFGKTGKNTRGQEARHFRDDEMPAADSMTPRISAGAIRHDSGKAFPCQDGRETETTELTGNSWLPTFRTASPLDQSTLSTIPETVVFTVSGRLEASFTLKEMV